ncbi:MAG: hypothetical protein ACQKBT_02105, partial [Puniceicoccales bacterium]
MIRIISSPFLILCIAFFLSFSQASARTVDVRFIGIETSNNDFYVKKGDEFYSVSVPLYENSAYYEADTV